MEKRFFKDFVIIIGIVLLIAFAIRVFYLYQDSQEVAKHSRYKEIALKDTLLNKIHKIEKSIKDRKQFTFTVEKDPLEQNLIVKTNKDLEQQWKQEIEKMVRLESTIIPEDGDKLAAIAHKGKTRLYKIGDNFVRGKILDIRQGEITYSYFGQNKTMKLKKIPPKPKELTKEKDKKRREYNW